MNTLRIQRMTRTSLVETNTEFLEVEAQILQDGELVEKRKFGYPLSITQAEIQADLEKFLDTYTKEQEASILDKELRAQEANADQIIEALTGASFAPKE